MTWALDYINIKYYSSLQTVSDIISDQSLVTSLKLLMAREYDSFINNFEVFNKPLKTADGGLLFKDFLEQLILENASVLVIYPDGGFIQHGLSLNAMLLTIKLIRLRKGKFRAILHNE
ncbi:hypothetical protein C2E15_03670 [Mixta gaviniae]|uniref:Uncharacterized protein n=2 Tax=Mixta gaviniae TaxID=665914 RepID=A0A2L0ICR8_9GAMM|nr:hypothetical protein C2E15_03670 [Mixta gaviniae]